MDSITIGTASLTATIKADGAELCSLRNAAGTEIMWPATAPWPRHAPNLFPIVGRLRDDRLHVDGQDYRVTQHGFARDNRFEWAQRGPDACRLVLSDSPATRELYPFVFRFEITYVVQADTLAITFRVTNPGDVVLPASMGAHPAFRWPLVDGIAKQDHVLEFAKPETAPIRRVSGGLMVGETFPNPVQGTRLPLDVALFAHDAIIMDKPASNSVTYTAPGAPLVEVSWDDGFPELGIWSRPDADLLCIEPWHGMSSPADFDGDFHDKPGVMLIPPGEARRATYRIRVS
jgi:galactose mutarotase-like enzyme